MTKPPAPLRRASPRSPAEHATLPAPAVTVTTAPRAALARGRRLILGLFSPEALPLTAVNALLLLVLATVAIGIEVAF